LVLADVNKFSVVTPSSREGWDGDGVRKWYREGYFESNVTGYFCGFIYESGYADIYDHIIQYGGCSLGKIRGGRKE
jgi:hypothetical protein